MNEVKGYRCPNCGNMMRIPNGNIFKCDCCGSEYEREDSYLKPLKVVTYLAPMVTINAYRSIPEECLHDEYVKEEVVKATLEDISREIAKNLIPYTEITTERDLFGRTITVGGKVRVAALYGSEDAYNFLRSSL